MTSVVFNKHSSSIKFLLITLYFIVSIVICRYAKKNSQFDLDIVFYTACALEKDSMSAEQLHDLTYETARKDLGELRFKALTDKSKHYRNSIYKSADNFYSQLPNYRIKPMYVWLLALADRMGFSPILFSVYINLIAYLLIGIIMLFYLIKHLTFYPAYIISFCVMLFPIMLGSVKSNTPDMLSALFILIGTILLLSESKTQHNLSVIVYALSMFVRPENIIFILVFYGVCFISKTENYPKKLLHLLLAFSACSYVFVTLFYKAYPWTLLYKHSFLGFIPDLQHANANLSLKGYINGLRFLPNSVFHSEFFIVILFLAFPLFYKALKKDKMILMSYALLVSIIIRVLLLPDLAQRYYVGIFLVSCILFFRTLFEKNKLDKYYLN